MKREEIEQMRRQHKINETNAFIERECGAGSAELTETKSGLRVTYEAACGKIDISADPWVLHDIILQLTLIKMEIERANLKEV